MKKIFEIVLTLLILAALPCSVLATDVSPGAIVDQADLLDPMEESTLEDMAWQFYHDHGLFTAILTVDDLDGKTATAYADDFYDQNYYWDYPDGILLLISTGTREWAISTCGTGIHRLTDWELDALFYSMSDSLAADDYYSAFLTFLNCLPDYWLEAAPREPGFGDYLRIVLVSLAIGAGVGGIAILIMRGQMNTAKAQHNAGNYLVDGSYQLKKHLDIFLYSRVTRTHKPQNNGGGGSSHRSSGGISHGGRSGRF